ncbi:hypothetical protein ACIQCG_01040 [Streptomyces noursei]|uniref:hypothetical protein n=1 Tax=Streptomyces noursei TaxID=1971 RepID=UPI003823131F
MGYNISGSPGFEREMLALVEKYLAVGELTVTPDLEWTPGRAAAFWRIATPPARMVVLGVIEAGGVVRAETLRETHNLKALSGSVTATMTRGVREGLWPDGMPNPITREYNPKKPSHKELQSYRMPEALVPVFKAAFEGWRKTLRYCAPEELVSLLEATSGS